MSNYPLVSICIPTYNRSNSYFPESLHSALNQDYPNLEIIVADNCSTDGTSHLVNKLSDPRLKYYRHPKNISLNDNFNFCLNQASGEYLLLLHDDYLIDHDLISSCMEALQYGEEVGVIRCGARLIDSHGNTTSIEYSQGNNLSLQDFFLAWFGYLKNPIPLYYCNTLFNTRLLIKYGGFNSKTNLYQDVVAIARLISDAGHLDIGEVKASFRKHGTSYGTASKIIDWCEDSLYLLDIICNSIGINVKLTRSAGMRSLCKSCYSRARHLNSIPERFKAYFIIYKYFNYSYSPIRYNSKRIQMKIQKKLNL